MFGAIFALAAAFPGAARADVSILEAGAGVEFVDMGLDPATGAITLVGTEGGVASVFQVDAALGSISSAELVGLGSGTQVFGISPEGTRIAGVSQSPGSIDIGEGTTWLSDAPESPVGIGWIEGFTRTSLGGGAWVEGVVGQHSGAQDAIRWTPGGGLVPLEDGGGLSEARCVSADGEVVVGVANSILSGGAPCYWVGEDFRALPNPVGNDGRARTISPQATFIGGYIGFFVFDPFDAGIQATLWRQTNAAAATYEIIPLTRADGYYFKGEVEDVTDSGYAVGRTADENPERAFLWHPSFACPGAPSGGAPVLLDDWLEALDGGQRPATPSGKAVAIAQAPGGDLIIAVASPARVIRATPPPADSDCDGLLDADETALGTDPFAADSDGDGFNDGAEQALGTDPLSGTSRFEATLAGPEPAPGGGEQVRVTFPAKPGNRYAIETSSTLAEASWQSMQELTASEGETELTATLPVPENTPRLNYRVRFLGAAE
ncbi:MAG: hypothetical protein KDN22_13665 [Verrucomicrobiae bacterium]|nr:hypothetical protein [Verrucomicrobiae bacterium]